MSSQVVTALTIEFFFIGVTCLFLLKPKWFFGALGSKSETVMSWAGMALLVVTFCWSVILGCILYLNDIVIHS